MYATHHIFNRFDHDSNEKNAKLLPFENVNFGVSILDVLREVSFGVRSDTLRSSPS